MNLTLLLLVDCEWELVGLLGFALMPSNYLCNNIEVPNVIFSIFLFHSAEWRKILFSSWARGVHPLCSIPNWVPSDLGRAGNNYILIQSAILKQRPLPKGHILCSSRALEKEYFSEGNNLHWSAACEIIPWALSSWQTLWPRSMWSIACVASSYQFRLLPNPKQAVSSLLQEIQWSLQWKCPGCFSAWYHYGGRHLQAVQSRGSGHTVIKWSLHCIFRGPCSQPSQCTPKRDFLMLSKVCFILDMNLHGASRGR